MDEKSEAASRAIRHALAGLGDAAPVQIATPKCSGAYTTAGELRALLARAEGFPVVLRNEWGPDWPLRTVPPSVEKMGVWSPGWPIDAGLPPIEKPDESEGGTP